MIWTRATFLFLLAFGLSFPKANGQDTLRTPSTPWHIALLYGSSQAQSETVMQGYENSGYTYVEKDGVPSLLGFHIERDLLRDLRLGILVYSAKFPDLLGSNWRKATFDVPHDRFDVTERLVSRALGISADYLLVSSKKPQPGNFEFGFGAGFTLLFTSLKGNQSYVYFASRTKRYNDTTASFKINKLNPGLMLFTHLDLYLTRWFSVQWRLQATVAPSIPVPAQTYRYQTGDLDPTTLSARTLGAHRIRLTSFLNLLMLRVHH